MSPTPHLDFTEDLKSVTRLEVIDERGRTFVAVHGSIKSITASLQDDNRTLKLFLTKHPEKVKG